VRNAVHAKVVKTYWSKFTHSYMFAIKQICANFENFRLVSCLSRKRTCFNLEQFGFKRYEEISIHNEIEYRQEWWKLFAAVLHSHRSLNVGWRVTENPCFKNCFNCTRVEFKAFKTIKAIGFGHWNSKKPPNFMFTLYSFESIVSLTFDQEGKSLV
jgi:hypothetical protein